MKKRLTYVATAFFLAIGFANAHAAKQNSGLRFSIIKTSEVTTLDALTYSGGKWLSKARMNHVAVLVEHPKGRFLFDTGLGRHVDEQFKADMPLWLRPMFGYKKVTPALNQLLQAGSPLPKHIILSHAHWDHASGIKDFPGAKIWITDDEHGYLSIAPSGPVMPSQFTSPSPKWHHYQLKTKPWRSFAKSLDLFGDGSAVLVDQGGHTPGSVALYLRTNHGLEVLLCGDTVWRARALQTLAPKSALASRIVDADADATHKQIEHLATFARANPKIKIIPAHDAEVQDLLGYFPNWVD